MTFDAVCEIINEVCEAEAISHHYRRHLATQLDSFHKCISVFGNDPAKDLCNFVIAYSQMVPRKLKCIFHCAYQSNTLPLFQASLELAERYFLHPSEIIAQHPAVASLLVRSYQCHRLIEELYENNKTLRNQHIHECQTMQVNLLAHQLIGESLANDIDNATFSVFRNLVSMPDYYDVNLQHFIKACSSDAWLAIKKDWDGLLATHNIAMNFTP